MRLGRYFTWQNKIAIVDYKVTIKLLLICHYCDESEHSHVVLGILFHNSSHKQILYHYDVKVRKGENDGQFYPRGFALKDRNKTPLSFPWY